MLCPPFSYILLIYCQWGNGALLFYLTLLYKMIEHAMGGLSYSTNKPSAEVVTELDQSLWKQDTPDTDTVTCFWIWNGCMLCIVKTHGNTIILDVFDVYKKQRQLNDGSSLQLYCEISQRQKHRDPHTQLVYCYWLRVKQPLPKGWCPEMPEQSKIIRNYRKKVESLQINTQLL